VSGHCSRFARSNQSGIPCQNETLDDAESGRVPKQMFVRCRRETDKLTGIIEDEQVVVPSRFARIGNVLDQGLLRIRQFQKRFGNPKSAVCL
jgi:hypothetical protein